MATISADPACCLTDTTTKSQLCPTKGKETVGLLESDINKIVERKLRSNNFCVLHWSLDSLEETNGYLGQYYTLSVTVKIDNKSRHLKFFVKTPPPPTSPQYDFIIRHNTFNKEIFIYSELIPKLGRGIGAKWAPDYYLSKSNAMLVLEDATQEGYVTPDKYIALDEEHCISVVKAISTFHSRSLILDEKLRQSTGQTILDLYGDVLKELSFVASDVTSRKYLSSCVKGAWTMVDLVEGLDQAEATMIKNWIATWAPKLPDLLKSSDKYRNVMCHRDIWPNNIMFKRDAATGKPVGCYLIDFQFLRYNPPAIDFMICLLLVTDCSIRRRLYDQLIDIYCDTMRKELAAEGLDMEKCLPREEFIASCNDMKLATLIYAITNIQIMLLTKQAVEKYFIDSTDQLEYVLYGDQRPELVKSQCESKKSYQTRITEVIKEIRVYLANNPARS